MRSVCSVYVAMVNQRQFSNSRHRVPISTSLNGNGARMQQQLYVLRRHAPCSGSSRSTAGLQEVEGRTMTWWLSQWRLLRRWKLFPTGIGFLLFLLEGCAAPDFLRDRHASYDPRTILPRGQTLQVDRHSRLTKTGQRIESFRCAHSPMWCSGNTVISDCRCP